MSFRLFSRASGAGALFYFIVCFAASPARAAAIVKGPYLQNPKTDGMTVCWVTDQEATGSLSCAPAQGGGAPKTTAETQPAIYHKVKVTGLKSYTRYRYTVSCDGQTAEGSFRTAAPPAQPFRFAAYGDDRTQLDKHAAVLARMRPFQPDFVIQTGDLVQDGTVEAQWTDFFRVAADLLREAPYLPALGNHERSGAPYFHYFDVPREYSFDYGNAHFVALDSNRPPEEFAAQEKWLRKDLAAHQDATWRIVYFHHTPYTCVAMPPRRVAAEKLRARLEPIFLQQHVNLVINGHDHDYQHHLANGIHYVVTGGGGAPLYAVQPDTPFVKAAKSAHHYCELTVNGSRMSVRAVEPDGTVIEQFEIQSPASAK